MIETDFYTIFQVVYDNSSSLVYKKSKFEYSKKHTTMKKSVIYEFEKQITSLKKTEGFDPRHCTNPIPYAENIKWKDKNTEITAQFFDARHSYFSLLELSLKEAITLKISAEYFELFLVYQLLGSASVLQEDGSQFPLDWTSTIKEDDYVLLYSSPRTISITFEAGDHQIFFFMLSRDWLKSYAHLDGQHFQKLSHHLYNHHDVFRASKAMAISSLIRKHILFLFTLPVPEQKDLNMDARINEPLTSLLSIARIDLENSERCVEKLRIKETDVVKAQVIHDYIVEQTELGGKLMRAMDIAKHFRITHQQLNIIYNQVFGFSVNIDIMNERVKRTQIVVKQSNSNISDSEIARDVGYTDANHMVTQYKKYFGHHPREDRPDYKPPSQP